MVPFRLILYFFFSFLFLCSTLCDLPWLSFPHILCYFILTTIFFPSFSAFLSNIITTQQLALAHCCNRHATIPSLEDLVNDPYDYQQMMIIRELSSRLDLIKVRHALLFYSLLFFLFTFCFSSVKSFLIFFVLSFVTYFLLKYFHICFHAYNLIFKFAVKSNMFFFSRHIYLP